MAPVSLIVYISPGGSTRHVASTIESALAANGSSPMVADLAVASQVAAVKKVLSEAAAPVLLFIGSPVYKDRAVSPVMNFINQLETRENAYCVPFATWGGACSGLALWQMASALAEKGFSPIGGAKVMAVHSMMWGSDDPVGAGRPDASDDALVTELVKTVTERLVADTPSALPVSDFDYQPSEMSATIKKALETEPPQNPKTVDEEACTVCGTCAEVCPVSAIVMDPLPVFQKECFDCFSCIRECPVSAIVPGKPLTMVHEMIRNRVKTVQETPATQIFT